MIAQTTAALSEISGKVAGTYFRNVKGTTEIRNITQPHRVNGNLPSYDRQLWKFVASKWRELPVSVRNSWKAFTYKNLTGFNAYMELVVNRFTFHINNFEIPKEIEIIPNFSWRPAHNPFNYNAPIAYWSASNVVRRYYLHLYVSPPRTQFRKECNLWRTLYNNAIYPGANVKINFYDKFLKVYGQPINHARYFFRVELHDIHNGYSTNFGIKYLDYDF